MNEGVEFTSAAAGASEGLAYMHRRHTNLTLAAVVVVVVVMIPAHIAFHQQRDLKYTLLFLLLLPSYLQEMITGKIFTHAGLPLTHSLSDRIKG